MEQRSDFFLLLASVWFVGAALTDGFIQILSIVMASIWFILLCLWRWIEARDAKNQSEWQETWHR